MISFWAIIKAIWRLIFTSKRIEFQNQGTFSSNVGVIEVFSREGFNSVGLEKPREFSKIPRFLRGFKRGLYFSWFFFEKSSPHLVNRHFSLWQRDNVVYWKTKGKTNNNLQFFEKNIGWLKIDVGDSWLLSAVQVKLTLVFWKFHAFWKSFQNQSALKTVLRPASSSRVISVLRTTNMRSHGGIYEREIMLFIVKKQNQNQNWSLMQLIL